MENEEEKLMKIGVLKKGDKVLNVTGEFVAVERKNGEVDIIPIVNEGANYRVDLERIVTIGYGNNVVQDKDADDVVITTF